MLSLYSMVGLPALGTTHTQHLRSGERKRHASTTIAFPDDQEGLFEVAVVVVHDVGNAAADVRGGVFGVVHHNEADGDRRDNHASREGNPFDRHKAVLDADEIADLVLERVHWCHLSLPSLFRR